jgi:hypothetical protein
METVNLQPTLELTGTPAAGSERYIRRPEHDKRFKRGDDYAADAWLDTESGEIREVVVNHNPNGYAPLTPNK